jgi:hypothetical protein
MGRIIALNQYFTIGTRSFKERKLKNKNKKKKEKRRRKRKRKKEGIFNSEMQMDRIIASNQYFTIGTRSFKERKLKRKRQKKKKKKSGNFIKDF